jgi:hypothetical protein
MRYLPSSSASVPFQQKDDWLRIYSQLKLAHVKVAHHRHRPRIYMDRIFLSIICSGILLLVTAFSLATPGIKYADPPREQTILARLMQR